MEQSDIEPPRMVVCLIAGREAVDGYPALLRYLQLGLVDEHVETLRVALQGEPVSTLQTGTTVVMEHRPPAWPLSRWSHKTFVTNVHRKLESLQRGSPAVVHALGPSAAALAGEIADATGSELVVTLSSLSSLLDPAAHRWNQQAARLIVLSSMIGDELYRSVQQAKPAEIIRVGVPTSQAPAAFKGGERAPVLVYSGPLTEDAGLDCMFRAVKQALMRHANLLVFVMGKGPAEDGLRRLADSLEIQASVTFTGKIEDWRSVLEAADIFCVPHSATHWREEPLCALAAGVCVVAAEGGVRDDLIDGRTALLFPLGDDVRLAQRIMDLLKDPAGARQLAAAGQEHVRTHHAPAKMVEEHLRVYRSLTSRHQTLAFPGKS